MEKEAQLSTSFFILCLRNPLCQKCQRLRHVTKNSFSVLHMKPRGTYVCVVPHTEADCGACGVIQRDSGSTVQGPAQTIKNLKTEGGGPNQ